MKAIMNKMCFIKGDVPNENIVVQIAVLIILSTTLIHLRGQEAEVLTPTIGMVYLPCGRNDFVIQVEKCDPGDVDIRSVNYELRDDAYRLVEGGGGTLYDIYGLNFDFKTTMITFSDNDRDLHVSAGDVILMRSFLYGGITSYNYTLLLIYEPTGERMNGGGTHLG